MHSAVPPGGRDKRGGPILTFPARSNHDRIRQEDLRRLISYLACIPRYFLWGTQCAILLTGAHRVLARPLLWEKLRGGWQAKLRQPLRALGAGTEHDKAGPRVVWGVVWAPVWLI